MVGRPRILLKGKLTHDTTIPLWDNVRLSAHT
jgi:ABC-type transporter Mla MlaB component